MILELDNIRPDHRAAWFVAPNATLVGRVRLGAGSSVWFGAVLRGDCEEIAVGAGANVQDNAVLHTDPGFPLVVGEAATIGHSAILHGCRIGDGALVGMGAVVMNGARIGRNCLVGAHALVTENKCFPDGSVLRGSPAVVVGAVSERQLAAMAANAAGYAERARRYRSGLVVVPDPGPSGG